MDVDTVKGCTLGMRAGKNGRGCYDECYANDIASRYGIDFGRSVSEGFADHRQHKDTIIRQLLAHNASWYRIK